MLCTRMFLRSINAQAVLPIKQFSVAVRLYSSSDSSDSSDSDSDATVPKKKSRDVKFQKNTKNTNVTPLKLEEVLAQMMNKKPVTKQLEVSVTVEQKKQPAKTEELKESNMPFAQQLKQAAEDVEATSKGRVQITSDLLSILTEPSNIKTDIPIKREGKSTKQDWRRQQSQKLPDSQNKISVARQLLRNIERERKATTDAVKRSRIIVEVPSLFSGSPLPYFKKMETKTTKSIELTTWNTLQQRELDLLSRQSPQNIFQEMIQWTEEGKLWKFPIDNEQGMEEEHNVHFSEHVFLERHLKGWCPKRGPIRHFMELVCVGLSKNPYLTVEEKVGHIMWYKDYFGQKEELLKELGAIEEPITQNSSKQIEAS